MAQPDSKKIFFENLSGAGKSIAVLTSGGDAQGTVRQNVTLPGDIVPVWMGPQRAKIHLLSYLILFEVVTR